MKYWQKTKQNKLTSGKGNIYCEKIRIGKQVTAHIIKLLPKAKGALWPYIKLFRLYQACQEKTKVILLGDFNANLFIKYDNSSNVSDFLDVMYWNSFLPNTASPTCMMAKSKTLINNIFTNNYELIKIQLKGGN